MKYSYYPGCSLERNAAAYHVSTMEVAEKLGFELAEVEDWNCCGATEYISLNLIASYALIARNLAQAAHMPGVDTLVAPCSACFLNLKKCDKYMSDSPVLSQKVNTALAAGGLHYQPGSLNVRHLLDVVVYDIGQETIKEKVVQPLHGLRVAPYYGCMIVRPQFNGSKQPPENPEYPTSMDDLMSWLGAEVVDFPMKAHCCGGHMTQISEATGFEMIRRLVKGAADYHADVIVAVCPMCQLNLDGFQGAMNRYFKTNYHVPVLYFTQLLGLAFGCDAKALGIGDELVDARPALSKIGIEHASEGEGGSERKTPRPRKDDQSLPMPKMPPPEQGQREVSR